MSTLGKAREVISRLIQRESPAASSVGRVVSSRNGLYDVVITDMFGSEILVEGVPLLFSRGIKPQEPREGDSVVVSFLMGNTAHPVIVNVLDEFYPENTAELMKDETTIMAPSAWKWFWC